VTSRQSASGETHPELFRPGEQQPEAAPNELRQIEARKPSSEPGASPATAIEVSTLTGIIRDILEGAFRRMWIRGEVTGFKRQAKGHWYFSLRDDNAVIKCVMWATDVQRVKVPPVEGMSVVALGVVRVHEKAGEVQVSVKALQPVGEGMWLLAFEETRKRLDAEGLFAASRKRALPFLPRRIAIVTSQDGAALHDIVTGIRKRCPIVELVLVPAQVQGEDAPKAMRRALTRLARWRGADLVIIGRGGGSREDLWAFNDEMLARAIASFPVPTISAVGHEVDVTICDLVADHRAPTPTAAAEIAVPDLNELRAQLVDCAHVLSRQVTRLTALGHERLASITHRLQARTEQLFERRRMRLESCAGRLDALSPLATFRRGYAAVFAEDGRSISDARGVEAGDGVEVRMRDGSFAARVESKTLRASQ
jgi:exodeoxyribonuclease VII large subunit